MSEADNTAEEAECTLTRAELFGPGSAFLLRMPTAGAEGDMPVCRHCGGDPLEHGVPHEALSPPAAGRKETTKEDPVLWVIGDVASRVLSEPLDVANLIRIVTEKPADVRRYTGQAKSLKTAAAVRGSADPLAQLGAAKRMLELIATRLTVALGAADWDAEAPPLHSLNDVVAGAAMGNLNTQDWARLTAIVQAKAVGLGFLIEKHSAELASGTHRESAVKVRVPEGVTGDFEDWFRAVRREDAENAAVFLELLLDARSVDEIGQKTEGDDDFAVGIALAGHSFDRRQGDLSKLWKELERRDAIRRERLATSRKDEVQAAKDAKKKKDADDRARSQAEILAGAAPRAAKRPRGADEKDVTEPKKKKSGGGKDDKVKAAAMAKPPAERTKSDARRWKLCMICKEPGHQASACKKTAPAAVVEDDKP
jgi:hypothetical protein